MKFIARLYRYVNILSLDVVLGAIISALFFGRLVNCEFSVAVVAALGLTVWIIYTADHLRDARNVRGPACTDRHRFHQQYFNGIILFLLFVLFIDLIAIVSLPAQVLKAGVTLGILVLLYLMLQRYLKFMKEIFVAVLYTAGVLIPSVSTLGDQLPAVHYIIISKFAITALMNLLLFSLFDLEADRNQQQHSFVTWFGPRRTIYAIVWLGILNFITGFWLWDYDARVAVAFIAMNTTLLSILYLRQNMIQNNYYRIAGEAVFFIPAVFLL